MSTMRHVELSVPGARCGVCRAAIVAALQALPGVRHAVVDLPRRRVAVSFDTGVTTTSGLCAGLTDAGYPAAYPTGVDGPVDPVWSDG